MDKFHKIYITIILILILVISFFLFKSFSKKETRESPDGISNTNVTEYVSSEDKEVITPDNSKEILNTKNSYSVNDVKDLENKTTQPVESSNEVVVDQTNAFDVSVNYVTQSILPGDDYEYGGYEIGLSITANVGDVYIPKNTTDSSNGVTGFPYSINGDFFRGGQDSSVSCSLVSQNNFCRIKEGETKEITVTVWLFPDISGNYGIEFESFRYSDSIDSYFDTFNLSLSTDNLYF